jgi:hypothetical protein
MFLYGERVWIGMWCLVSDQLFKDVTAFICSIIITTTVRIEVCNDVVYVAWNNPVSFLVLLMYVFIIFAESLPGLLC